jgi:hypothetical protein
MTSNLLEVVFMNNWPCAFKCSWFSLFNAIPLPIPKSLDVESQPVSECKKGNKWQISSPRKPFVCWMFHIFIFLFIAILSDLKITHLHCWLTWWISNTNKSVSSPITMTSDDKAQSTAVCAIKRSASSTAF